jgi:hypothetical protein
LSDQLRRLPRAPHPDAQLVPYICNPSQDRPVEALQRTGKLLKESDVTPALKGRQAEVGVQPRVCAAVAQTATMPSHPALLTATPCHLPLILRSFSGQMMPNGECCGLTSTSGGVQWFALAGRVFMALATQGWACWGNCMCLVDRPWLYDTCPAGTWWRSRVSTSRRGKQSKGGEC